MSLKSRIKNLLITLDQVLLSVLTLGEASPRQTCSAAAWNMEQRGRLFWFDPHHCEFSYINETTRGFT